MLGLDEFTMDAVGRSNLAISMGKGFRITFANGWAVSVQFGPGNYCNNKYVLGWPDTKRSTIDVFRHAGENGSPNAEIAIIGPGGGFHRPRGWTDDVLGYVAPDEILKWMRYAARQK